MNDSEEELILRRVAETAAAAISRLAPGSPREELQAAAQDGDYHVETAPDGRAVIYVGLEEVGDL